MPVNPIPPSVSYPSMEAINIGPKLPLLPPEKPKQQSFQSLLQSELSKPTNPSFSPASRTATSFPTGVKHLSKDKVNRYSALIETKANQYGIDPNLLWGVVKAESDFDPKTVSSAGAMGLTQLMPENVQELGIKDPYDPVQNVDGGARHLREMLDRFRGDVRLALAAYNAGPGNVIKYKGIPPFNETQTYVKRVLNYAQGR